MPWPATRVPPGGSAALPGGRPALRAGERQRRLNTTEVREWAKPRALK